MVVRLERTPTPPHPPTPPPLLLFLSSLSPVIHSFQCVHLSDPLLSSRLPLIFVIHPSVLSSRFPLWSNHNNSSPILSIHHLSLLHLNPLLLCLYISLTPLSPSPQICYFLLCMEDTFSLWSLGK